MTTTIAIAEHSRVLIVDDDSHNRELLEVMLMQEGFVLLQAASGEQALALVAENPPDLILLDVMMPGMDGYEVARTVKANPSTSSIPIIVVTALDDRSARMSGLSAGAEDFLTKPVDRAELCVRVRNLLRLKAYGDYHDKHSRMLEEQVRARTADLHERTTALEQHAIALRRNEERTSYALSAARMGVWELDIPSQRLTWSATMAPLFGLTSDQAPADREGFLVLVHPDDRQMIVDSLEEAVRGGPDSQVEFRAICPDGSTRWLRGCGRLERDSENGTVRLLGISMDIHEHKLLEAQLRQTSKMDAIGQLASGIAHDFNNLLTVILGFGEMLTEDGAVTSRHGAELAEIVKAAERAAGLTRQLLAFSRQQLLRAKPLDVNALIMEMAGMLGMLIGEDIQVALTLPATLCLAFADRGQVEQVVMNLVVNAKDAMPKGGRLTIETANVELEASSFHGEEVAEGQYVMLAVGDTGYGMSEETQRRLFEPFFTTKEPGKGTGLGLSTTYGIVKQSKGYIWVYSEPGHGTTFKVYVPCASREAPVASGLPIASTPAVRPSETILLVEDEAGVRLLSKRILSSAGYRVLEAANGGDAEIVFAAHADTIDLVVTDVVMPGCGGPELLARLQLHTPALKVLYMSGYTEQSAAQKAGIDRGLPFIQKPFTAAQFVRSVRDALHR